MSEVIDAGTTTQVPAGGDAKDSKTTDPTGAQPPGPADQKPAEPPAKVPEAYELKGPEGMELDAEAVSEFSGIAKELGLDQAGAQKVADVAVKMAQRQAEQHVKLVESWAEQVKTDKEIGGDKLEENLAVARKARDAFGSDELKALLDSTGVGNHPAVVKFFVKVGKAVSEDGMVRTGQAGAQVDPARKMFPGMN